MVGFAGYHIDDYTIFFAWVSRSLLAKRMAHLTFAGLLYGHDSRGTYRLRYW
jgi:hypothetical protein